MVKNGLFIKKGVIYKFLRGLSPPTMIDIFKVGGNICNLRNFESLYSTCKKTMRFGTETITYRGSQIWNLIPDSVLKMDLLWRNSRGRQKIERRKVSM